VDVRVERSKRAGWIAPVELDPMRKKVRGKPNSRRATNKACPPTALAEYRQLLDSIGRRLHRGKRGVLLPYTPPVLDKKGDVAQFRPQSTKQCAASPLCLTSSFQLRIMSPLMLADVPAFFCN